MPWVDLAAGILFSGCSPAKCVDLSAGICGFSKRTFYRIQQKILLPAVDQVFKFWYEARNSQFQ